MWTFIFPLVKVLNTLRFCVGCDWFTETENHLFNIRLFTTGPPGPGPKLAQRWIPRPRDLQIAFYIGLSKNIQEMPKGPNCPLVFDNVLLNMGNFYNISDGIFTAPASGVYTFLLVVSAHSYEKVCQCLFMLTIH